MASTSSIPPAAGPNTEISIKISAQGVTRKLKLPLKDLVPSVLPHKLRLFLNVQPVQVVVFERFSDSSATYVNLDANNVQAYKTLYRAAKAKLKLRLRAHVGPVPNPVFPTNASTLNLATSNTLNDFANSIQNLANINFGSRINLDNAPVVTALSQAPLEPPIYVPPPAIAAVEPVATAVANFCQTQSSSSSQPRAEDSSIEAKSQEFNKTIREIDEELKLKIDAHKARQDLMASNAAAAARMAAELACRRKSSNPKRRSAVDLANPPKLPEGATFSWSVYCNHCSKNMLEEHFHCNSCEGGDYDLCTDCMAKGKHCLDERHWLIKRFLRDGKVINGETHKVVPSPKIRSAPFVNMPGAFDQEKKAEELKKPTRTCNCCVTVLCEDEFVNCKDCHDYDLCIQCLHSGDHGHHPAHTFVPATNLTKLTTHAHALCKPGRNVTHAALCDECDSRIVGVRYKCLTCPDWDYCSTCMQKSSSIHKGHRFAPVYDSISPQSCQWAPTHAGVYCDGPLCKDKNSYITGVRYKCAVCPDLDFCAGCEALPHLGHNMTHPVLKFRTPVRGCSVTTMVGEDQARNEQDHVSKTQICTVAEVKPTDCSAKIKEKIEIKDIIAQPSQAREEGAAEPRELQAYFARDTISDGTIFEPQKQFIQTWTLRNPGPEAWPAGCSVRYVGGDNMLNIHENSPSTDVDFAKATESNVIRRDVEVGEEISFRVLMKAPKREGVAISYWRLKTADGMPFGHRLWCHINVTSKSEKSEAQPGIGRLGAHDAFLRYSLNEQVKRENGKKIEMADTDAALRDIAERLKNLRAETHELSGQEADAAKSEKVKIEVVESTDVPAAKTVSVAEGKQKLSFPVLDVESSASSSATEPVTTNTVTVENVPAVAPLQQEPSIFDDAESITVAESIDLSDDSSDDGFMTEDEYDILDASDNEVV